MELPMYIGGEGFPWDFCANKLCRKGLWQQEVGDGK
jgi:hypothetical protein